MAEIGGEGGPSWANSSVKWEDGTLSLRGGVRKDVGAEAIRATRQRTKRTRRHPQVNHYDLPEGQHAIRKELDLVVSHILTAFEITGLVRSPVCCRAGSRRRPKSSGQR